MGHLDRCLHRTGISTAPRRFPSPPPDQLFEPIFIMIVSQSLSPPHQAFTSCICIKCEKLL